ncbi:MAG TPA: efflux RND transporter periplasmic adaptor subunit [Rhodopila sp.]
MIPLADDDTVARESDRATGLADPWRERRRGRIAKWLGLGALVTVAGLVAVGAWGHASRRAATIATLDARHAAVPVVHIAAVQPVDSAREIDLPGNIQAFDSATLFARATGYISTRNVDIGSRVRAGDVLAVIAAPDLDQQLAQARGQLVQLQAAVTQAVANMELARVTTNRTSQLVRDGWTSVQQGDNDRLGFAAQAAAAAVARANVEAQQSAVSRLEQLTGFERVVAPFNGVITARQVDVGSLVTADAASGTPLFSIDRTDVLRVQIYVPQDAFFGLKDGNPAEVTVPELPGRVFHGTVARNANSLQQQTRTLLTEVDVNNADGTLTAGLYGVVHLKEPRSEPVVLVPSGAVIFDKDGLSAAVYENGEARLRHLDLEADDGAQVVVRSGLRQGDQLILNPPVGVTDRMRVMTPAGAKPVATALKG